MNYRKITHWTLFGLTILYLVTGLSIEYFAAAEAVTFGLLTKSVSFQIHELLIYPYIPALVLHLYFKLRRPSRTLTR